MLLELFELASNNALEHDPDSLAKLARLEGKTMVLHVRPIDQSLAITPQPHGIEYSRTIIEPVDVKLSATVGALIKISRDGIDDAELEPGELEIVGDAIIGQRFAQLIAGLNIDWEGFLADTVGDTQAHLITATAIKAKEFVGDSREHLKGILQTMLKDDLQLLVGEEEVDAFLDDVDELRADTDQLRARLKQLLDRL